MSQTQKIKIMKAFLRRDLRVLSDMAPFVILQMGGVSKRSMVDQKGGKKPTWNQTLEFKTAQTAVKVSVFDSGNFGDQLIGTGKFDILNLQPNQNQVVVDINHGQKVVGKLYLKIVSKPIIVALEFKPKQPVFEQAEDIKQESKNILGNAAKNLLSPQMSQRKNFDGYDKGKSNAFEDLFKNVPMGHQNRHTTTVPAVTVNPVYSQPQPQMSYPQPQAMYGNQGYFPAYNNNVAYNQAQYPSVYPQPNMYPNVQPQYQYPYQPNHQTLPKQNNNIICVVKKHSSKPDQKQKGLINEITSFFD